MSREWATRRLRSGTSCLLAGVLLGFAAIAWLFLFFSLPLDSWEIPSPVYPLLLVLLAGILVAAGVVLRTSAETTLRNRPLTFLTPEEETRVLAAIAEFESRSSGEIRVHLARRVEGEILAHARRCFEQIGMTKTKLRNGVLFFVGVQDRRFAVLGDQGIDRVVPDDFWNACVTRVRERFAEGHFADGLCEGIELAGAALAEHFPIQPDDINELPDGISRN